MKIIQIHEPFYNVDINYFLDGTIPEVNKLLKERFGDAFEDHEDDTDAFQSSVLQPGGDGELFYVFIADPDMDLLWHETMHLAFDILRQRGVKYSYNCEDAFAYLGGHIFTALFKKNLEGLQLKKIML